MDRRCSPQYPVVGRGADPSKEPGPCLASLVDALIQAPPVADEVVQDVEQAGSEEVGAGGKDIRQCHSQPMQALSRLPGDPTASSGRPCL